MAGRVGATKLSNPSERYRSYRCVRASTSKEACAFNNGHAADKLETAVLEYLSQFSDPTVVMEILQASEEKDMNQQEAEIGRIRKKLKAMDTALLNDLDRLDRHIIQEQEFTLRNEARRAESSTLQARESELNKWYERVKNTQAQVERLPKVIGSFIEDVQNMDIRWQKAQMQTILKAAHIFRDGRIELEFRE